MDDDSSPDESSLHTPMTIDTPYKEELPHTNGLKMIPLHPGNIDETRLSYVHTPQFAPGSPEAPTYDDSPSTPSDSPRPKSPNGMSMASSPHEPSTRKDALHNSHLAQAQKV